MSMDFKNIFRYIFFHSIVYDFHFGISFPNCISGPTLHEAGIGFIEVHPYTIINNSNSIY